MAVTPLYDADVVVNGDLVKLYDFFGAIRARLILIVCISVACGIAMTVLAFIVKPVYRGFAVLAPVTADSNPLMGGMEKSLSALSGGIAALTGLSDADRETDEAMAVLGSRELTESFIKDNNLLPILFPKLWDARAGRWKEGIKVPTLERGFQALDRMRHIDRDANNDFVTLQIDWPDRFKAANWTNQMAQRLNDEMRKRAMANADASLAYLRMELEKANEVATREAISQLMESQIKKKMLANVTQEFALRFVDEATIPDADFPARPNKLVMSAAGFVFGALVGIAVTLLLYRRALSRAALL